MRPWLYKVPFAFDLQRAADDLDEGRITLREAKKEIAAAIRKAAGMFPEKAAQHAAVFRAAADAIERRKTLAGVDSELQSFYDYADDYRIWLDANPKGPMEWRPS